MTFRKNHKKSVIVTTELVKNYLLVSTISHHILCVVGKLLPKWKSLAKKAAAPDIVAKCM